MSPGKLEAVANVWALVLDNPQTSSHQQDRHNDRKFILCACRLVSFNLSSTSRVLNKSSYILLYVSHHRGAGAHPFRPTQFS
jgi:hypothetical protein